MQREAPVFPLKNIAITPGGKPVIGKFFQILLNPGDEVMYPSPGYPIYESNIRFLGGVACPYLFQQDRSGALILDMDSIRRQFSLRTKIFILNEPHNPTGYMLSPEERREIAALCVLNNAWVLSDEAYFDLVYEGKADSIVNYPGMKDRTAILFTFSKTWGMTGWRLGACIGPKIVAEAIAHMAVNQEACTTHMVQYAGIAALEHPAAAAFTKTLLDELRRRRDFLVEAVQKIPLVSTTGIPNGAFYLWVEVTKLYAKLGCKSLDDFRTKILRETGVSFCTRNHFGQELPTDTAKFIRLAYSGIDIPTMKEAMTVLRQWVEDTIQMAKL